jgi:hypothetical protein
VIRGVIPCKSTETPFTARPVPAQS